MPWRSSFPGIGEKVRHRDGEIVKVLCRLAGTVPLASLNARDMDNLATALHRAGYAPVTCAHAWGVARKALRQARRWRLISGEPWAQARARSIPRSAPKITSREATERLAAHLEPYNPVAAALVRLMLGTGARKGELLALTGSDVSGACEQISIHRAVWEAGGRYAVKSSPKNAANTGIP